jgi:hypothetical protein
LIKYGKNSLYTIKLAKDVKVDGIFTIEDTASMLNGYRNGQNRGETTG